MVTLVNARDIRNNWGINGVPVSSNGAAILNYLNCRWVRNDLQFTGADGGISIPSSTSTDGFVGLAAIMVNSGMFDPNLKGQAILDGYYQDVSNFTWSKQKTFLDTALTLTNQNGTKIYRCIEGANEVGNNSQGNGGYAPDGTSQILSSDGVDGCYDGNCRQTFVAWAQALKTYANANTSKFSGVEIVAPTILDSILSNTQASSGNPGDYPANSPNGINISGQMDYGCLHWYASASSGSSAPCGPNNNTSGNHLTRYDWNYTGFRNGETGGSNNVSMVLSECGQAASSSGGTLWAADGISCAYSNMCQLLDHFAMGGKRVIFYTATGNANQDSGGTGHNGFNWFYNNSSASPTPSATCLRNISTLLSLKNTYSDSSNLSDTSSFTANFTGSNFSISGFDQASAAGSSYLILPKSDGSTMIAIWREPNFDNGNGASTTSIPSANNITVNFGTGSAVTYNVWDPSGGSGGSNRTISSSPTKIVSSASGTTASLTLYGVPLFIELPGVTITSVPAQPTGLSITSTTSTRVKVSWTAASTGQNNSPSSYKMLYQKGSNSGAWSTFATIDTSSNSFTYYGLDISSQYYFAIIATNSKGDSTQSANVNSTTSGNAPTTTPAVVGTNYKIVREDQITETSITLTLPNAPSSGNTVLVTYSGFSSGGNANTGISTTASNATKLIGPQYDGTDEVIWAWKFQSNGTNSFGPFTNYVSNDHAGWAICEVSNWAKEDIAHGNVTSSTATAVNWSAASPSASNNLILSLLSNTYAAAFSGSNSTGTSLLVGASSGVSFHQNALFKTVAGTISVGLTSGNTSNTTAAYLNVTSYGSGPPAQVTGVSSSNVTFKQATINWTSQGSAATSYRVEQSTNSGSSWTVVNQFVDASSNSYTVTGLAASTTYQYSVFAANDSGVSSRSSAVTVTTPSTPAIQVVQSATASDQSGVQSFTLSLSSAPTVGNQLFFYYVGKLGTTGPSVPSNATWSVALSGGSNTDQQQAAWLITAADSTKSWTFTGYSDLASAGVVEIQGVASNDTPVVDYSFSYTNGSHIDPTITAPSNTSKATGIAFIGMDVAPDAWGTPPTGLTLEQGGQLSTYGTNQKPSYHTCAIFKIAPSISTGTKQIPYTANGATQGGNPMMVAIEFIGNTAADVAPGTTSLTFGTITDTSIAYSWSAPSGTVTSYTISRSTSSDMSSPTTKSVTGQSSSDTGLTASTNYWYTIKAVNNTTNGSASSPQNVKTHSSNAGQPILFNSSPFLSNGQPIVAN